MATVKLTSKTIELPDDVIEALGLADGDELIVSVEENEIIVTPKARLDRAELFERTSKRGEELAERLGEEELARRIDKAAAEVRRHSVADQVTKRQAAVSRLVERGR